jgi:hypothetical protein
MPRLSAKSLGEVIALPAYQLTRILNEQKYPRQAPNSFKTHYYAKAKSAIKSHYVHRNSATTQQASNALAASSMKAHKISNNQRVITSFLGNAAQVNRNISPGVARHRVLSSNGVDFSLQFDLEGAEGQAQRLLFYNFVATPIDPQLARVTCEAAHWILEQLGIVLPMNTIEYVCLAAGVVHRFNQRRTATINHIQNTAKVIVGMWPGI